MKQIRKAVFPVAGLGTRFLPATKASPKEMLAVVDKPLIQYAVEEAYASGIREMIFVTGRNKRSIEDHFDVAYELEAELEAAGKFELKKLIDEVTPSDMECVYIRQPRSLGLGHAVLCAQSLIGDEPFAVLLADELTISETPVLRQLIRTAEQFEKLIIGLKSVTPQQVSNYGIVDGQYLTESVLQVDSLVEKPKPADTKSTLAISGRYVLDSSIFAQLKSLEPGLGGEIQLTDALIGCANAGNLLAHLYEGKTYDCGSKLGYLQASVDVGLLHPETSSLFSAWLESRGEL